MPRQRLPSGLHPLGSVGSRPQVSVRPSPGPPSGLDATAPRDAFSLQSFSAPQTPVGSRLRDVVAVIRKLSEAEIATRKQLNGVDQWGATVRHQVEEAHRKVIAQLESRRQIVLGSVGERVIEVRAMIEQHHKAQKEALQRLRALADAAEAQEPTSTTEVRAAIVNAGGAKLEIPTPPSAEVLAAGVLESVDDFRVAWSDEEDEASYTAANNSSYHGSPVSAHFSPPCSPRSPRSPGAPRGESSPRLAFGSFANTFANTTKAASFARFAALDIDVGGTITSRDGGGLNEPPARRAACWKIRVKPCPGSGPRRSWIVHRLLVSSAVGESLATDPSRVTASGAYAERVGGDSVSRSIAAHLAPEPISKPSNVLQDCKDNSWHSMWGAPRGTGDAAWLQYDLHPGDVPTRVTVLTGRSVSHREHVPSKIVLEATAPNGTKLKRTRVVQGRDGPYDAVADFVL
eukprot:Hpha_TRINITY_DN23757_c0_g1::TRINITY_DN23757_c0_g1_i1::g.93216::m.93216